MRYALRVLQQERTGSGRDLRHTLWIRWISARGDGAEEFNIDASAIDVA